MKILFTYLACFTLIFGAYAQKNNEPIVGKWHSENNESIIQIEESDGKVNGKIVWLKNPNDQSGKPKLDDQNQDTKLRSRPVMGMTILQGLKPDGKNKWSGGKIYDPKSGNTYSCELKLEGDVLKIRGYMGISLIGRTTTWQRAK